MGAILWHPGLVDRGAAPPMQLRALTQDILGSTVAKPGLGPGGRTPSPQARSRAARDSGVWEEASTQKFWVSHHLGTHFGGLSSVWWRP